MVVPVPLSTSKISRSLNWGKDALSSVVKSVSSEASKTPSIGVEGLALIGDNNAFSVAEGERVGASEADLVVPVPLGTSEVRRSLNGGEDTLSVGQSVASVAGQAVSDLIIGLALS